MQQIKSQAMTGPEPVEERSFDRFGIALPITMEGGEGETLDISETGRGGPGRAGRAQG